MTLTATTAPAAVAPDLSLLARHLAERPGLSRQMRLPRLAVLLCSLLLGGLVAWMALAPLDRLVHLQGRVIPSGKQQLVQHLEGGIVSQVLVREGQAVERGQVLLHVSSEQAQASLGEKQARAAGLRARSARLQAEADGLSAMPARGSADDAAEWAQQREAFVARQNRLAQALRVLEEQQAQKRQEIVEQASRRRGLAAELETARAQLNLMQTLQQRQAASQMEVLDAKARVERLGTQLAEAEAAIPRLEAAAQELAARAAEQRAQFRSDARTALADVQVELQRLEHDMGADTDRVRRVEVTAPVSGIVNKLFVNTVGGVVRPGETLVELTPLQSGLQIEARVTPAERGPLRVDQRTVVKVAAFDYTVHGTLEGVIREISPDTLIDERGERYFRVAIAVDGSSASRFPQPVSAGMTVTVDAVTGQRTVLQSVLAPVRGLADNALREAH
jgi:adhesin transport system membrane fusion protein